MKPGTEGVLDSVIRRSPAQPVFRWRAARRLAVLAYHGVDDATRFEQHLELLHRDANVVTAGEAVAAFEGRAGLPRHAVLITFDDGHRSVVEVALPMLRERGLPAAAFVVASVIDTDRPFWWAEVIELARRGGIVAAMPQMLPQQLVRALKRVPDAHRRAAIDELRATASAPASPMPQLSSPELRALESGGISVGNHTWSHPCLPRCGSDVQRAEVEDSHRALADMLGHEPTLFAYPNGDRDRSSARLVRDLGYRAAFLFDHALSPPRPPDALAVSRLRVNSTTSLDRFRTIVSGFHPSIHRVRGGG
jgi:peptidoglycan/xylan/chitin deacetylase (PgdA/CDA1 family)